MKIQELITILQECKEVYGDIDVYNADPDAEKYNHGYWKSLSEDDIGYNPAQDILKLY